MHMPTAYERYKRYKHYSLFGHTTTDTFLVFRNSEIFFKKISLCDSIT